MSDNNIPDNVVNLRGMRLYPKNENINAVIIQCLGEKDLLVYGMFRTCAPCRGAGRIYKNERLEQVVIDCPVCNGIGSTMVFLKTENHSDEDPHGPRSA